MHGGKSLIGPGSATFKTGRYSKFLPSRMAADFDRAVKDPQLVTLRKQIATVDARIIDILKRVDTGEAGAIWQQAQDVMAAFQRAKQRQDLDAMTDALNTLDHILGKGAADWAAWRELGQEIDRRRKLVDSEVRRLTTAHEVLTADRAMMLLAVVVKILQKHITDRQVLGAIAAEIQGMVLKGERYERDEQVGD